MSGPGPAGSGKVTIIVLDNVVNDAGAVNIGGQWLGLPTGTSNPNPALTALPTGAAYFNTGDNTLRIWNGSNWKSVALT